MRFQILKSILEMAKGVSIIVGIAFLFIIGLASWAGTPLLLKVADYEPHSLTLGVGIGLVFIVIALITAGWYLYNSVKPIFKYWRR